MKRSAPLAQRLHTEFAEDPKFDSARAPQIRLQAFDVAKMVEVGRRVRALYPTDAGDRIAAKVGDDVLRSLAEGVAGQLGGKVGVAPRIYLKRLVGLLDQVDEHPDFEPTKQFKLVIEAREMTVEERAASGRTVDDIDLDLGPAKGSGDPM